MKKQVPKREVYGRRVQALDFEYGECGPELQGQEFVTKRGDEELVACPIDIPGIDACMADLLSLCKRKEVWPRGPLIPNSRAGSQNGLLASLPKETVYDILMYLDDVDLNVTRRASREVVTMTSSQSFWRQKVFRQHPWISELLLAADTRGVDWFIVHNVAKELGNRRFRQAPGEDEKTGSFAEEIFGVPDVIPILHLYSRERIWDTCRYMYEHYRGVQAEALPPPELKSAVLHDVEMTPLVPLDSHSWDSSDLHLKMAPFVDSFHDLQDAEPVITVHWSENNILACIETRLSDTADPILLDPDEDDYRNRKEPFCRSDEIRIQAGDWLAALVITGDEMPYRRQELQHCYDASWDEEPELPYSFVVQGVNFIFPRSAVQLGKVKGEKRLFVPRKGTFPIGLAGECSEKCPARLVNLAMICHPIAKAQGPGMQRVAGSESIFLSRDPLATEYLWKNELPPPGLHIEPFFQDPFFRTQTCSLEPLVFGRCDADLAKMTAIGVDAWQQGIAVRYSDGSQRGIGPGRIAMEWHSIDDPGGERIISCHPSRNHDQDRMSLWSLRFITNRNRHLIFGNGPYYASDGDRLPRKESQGRILMGLYCHWENIYSRWGSIKEIQQNQAIGGFSAYHDKFIGGDILTDEADRFWYPSPPRGEQRLIGPVFGDPLKRAERPFNEKHESQLTKFASVAWFDCGKPLNWIKLVLCHPQYGDRLTLTSMTFNYTDGTRLSIGPTDFNALDKYTELGHPWCPCDLDLNKTDDMKERAHFEDWEWDVNGHYLTGFRVWEGEDGEIVGLRFVMDDGTETDTWGFEGGTQMRRKRRTQMTKTKTKTTKMMMKKKKMMMMMMKTTKRRSLQLPSLN